MTNISRIGNVPIEVAAKVLGKDSQTLRLMLQKGIFSWGCAFKIPGSRKYSYIIYAEPFRKLTGFRYEPGCNCEGDIDDGKSE